MKVDVNTRTKTVPTLLILAGLILLGYGLLLRSHPVDGPASEAKKTTVVREYQLVREVTVGGVERTELGHLRRTYSGSGPALCPT